MKEALLIFFFSLVAASLFSLNSTSSQVFTNDMEGFLHALNDLGFDVSSSGSWARDEGLPAGWEIKGSQMLTGAKNIFNVSFYDQKGLLRAKYFERNHDYAPTTIDATIYYYD